MENWTSFFCPWGNACAYSPRAGPTQRLIWMGLAPTKTPPVRHSCGISILLTLRYLVFIIFDRLLCFHAQQGYAGLHSISLVKQEMGFSHHGRH